MMTEQFVLVESAASQSKADKLRVPDSGEVDRFYFRGPIR